MGNNYESRNRYQQNQSLYSVMQVEKWVIYGILSLILVVAAFNMIGALTMLVLEKQKDIAVLKAMGADNSYIQRIFLNEGFVLAAFGGSCRNDFSNSALSLTNKIQAAEIIRRQFHN
ncbi:MAG: FtsX-like permease family protein [Segetibacter sp.]